MNSWNDIIEWPGMKKWMPFFLRQGKRDLFLEEYADIPLRLAAFWEPNGKGDDSIPKPAILIVPGGAYAYVSFPNEGVPIQTLMELHGYRAFILNYRTGENAKYPGPQMDLLESVKYLRENSAYYGIDPHRIAVIGFSAGGHLAASAAGKVEELCPEGKPDAVVLGYPVITLKQEYTHRETAENSCGADEELRKRLNVEDMITEQYPPTFIWTLEDDVSVPPVNSIFMLEALKKHHVKSLILYLSSGRPWMWAWIWHICLELESGDVEIPEVPFYRSK